MLLSPVWQQESIGRGLNALGLGLLIGVVGALGIAIAPLADLEESFGLHWMFNLRGAVRAPSEVVVVAIDEQSSRELGLPDKPRVWPRNLHAELTRYLAMAGARVIIFDMTFETPSAQPPHDEAFAAAMAEAGNVLITESVRKDAVRLQSPGGQAVGDVVIEKPVPPVPLLAQAALGRAPFLLPKDSRVSTYWTFRGDSGDTPTLPVLAFHVYGSDALADFLAVLRKTRPQLSLGAPASASQWLASEDGAISMRAARDALLTDPDIGEQVRRQLRVARDPDVQDDRRRLVQSFVSLYSDSAARYLNFYGPPRSIDTVPYVRVLQAARSEVSTAPFSFKNKAVFVGYSAATQSGQDRLRDDYRTVYSQPNGLDLSGVEIAATAFANLVEDRPLRPVAPRWQLAIVGAWGLVLGLMCRLLRPTRAVAAAGAMAAIFLWVVYSRFVHAAWWLPSIIPIGLQMPLALFAGVWLSYRDTKREREVIKRAFGYFLPSTVVDELTRNLGPVTRTNRVVFGACLSTDVEKYTTLAERMDPGQLGELMNQYYAELFVPVERSRGVVVDVVGDAMVAIWAKASSDVELRRNACQAALDIVEALDRFNEPPVDRPSMPTRFGLHAGDMLVGSIGASGHYEYRAVGDIVNTASRIQGLNKVLGTRLLASEETVASLDGFAIRPLGSFVLAGKANAVSVVELLGWKHNIGARRSELCESFAQALGAYRNGRLREAAHRFSAILESDPDDGPARFYQERCEHLLLDPPAGGWIPAIRIEVK